MLEICKMLDDVRNKMILSLPYGVYIQSMNSWAHSLYMMSLYNKQGHTSKWINLLPIFPVIQMNRPLHSLEMISRISRWNMENWSYEFTFWWGKKEEEEEIRKRRRWRRRTIKKAKRDGKKGRREVQRRREGNKMGREERRDKIF